MLAGLQFFTALFSLLQVAVMLRADHRRWENRLLALVVLIDAAGMVTNGFLVADGLALSDPRAIEYCLVWRILIVYPTLAFTYRFPFGDRPPAALRAVTLAASAAALVLAFLPATATWFPPRSGALFFLPFFVVIVRVQIRQVRRLWGRPEGRGAIWVVAAVALRWTSEMIAFTVVQPLG